MPKDRKVVKHVKWGGHAGVLVAGESFEALQLVLTESLLQRVTAESPTGLPYQAPLVGLLAASNLSQMHSARMNLSAQALSSGQEGAALTAEGNYSAWVYSWPVWSVHPHPLQRAQLPAIQRACTLLS